MIEYTVYLKNGEVVTTSNPDPCHSFEKVPSSYNPGEDPGEHVVLKIETGGDSKVIPYDNILYFVAEEL